MKSSNRLILVRLLLLLSAIPVVVRADEKPEGEDNLYSMGLFASISQMERTSGHIDDSKGRNAVRTDYRHMYVEKDPPITDRLPSNFGDYRVEFLDLKAQADLYKKVRKEFALLKIYPIQNLGPRLELTINVYYFSFRKHKWTYGLSDWSTVEFRFDCDKQKFVVSSVKLGGI